MDHIYMDMFDTYVLSDSIELKPLDISLETIEVSFYTIEVNFNEEVEIDFPIIVL